MLCETRRTWENFKSFAKISEVESSANGFLNHKVRKSSLFPGSSTLIGPTGAIHALLQLSRLTDAPLLFDLLHNPSGFYLECRSFQHQDRRGEDFFTKIETFAASRSIEVKW